MSVKSNRKIQTISLTDYCTNKNLRSGTPFIIRNGKGYHILGGVEVSQGTFDKLYPIPSMLFTGKIVIPLRISTTNPENKFGNHVNIFVS